MSAAVGVYVATAVQLLMARFASAATDNYEGCLEYNNPVTLTGTVLLRKTDYRKDDMPPEGIVSFPLLVLDQPICLRPRDDIDVAESMEWTLHISDACSRTWPVSSRVRVTGWLFHLFNWHHHSKVLIVANQIVRLDGQLPRCAKGSNR